MDSIIPEKSLDIFSSDLPQEYITSIKSTKSSNTDDTFKNTVAEYYKLKKKYDETYEKAKKEQLDKVITTDGFKKTTINMDSHNENKLDIIKRNRKCVICQKKGGTIFTNKNRIITAKCGNEDAPCDLDIQINLGKHMSLNNALKLTNETISTTKASIIDLKLDLLFGLRTEEEISLDFEEDKQQYKTSVKHAESIKKLIKSIDEILIEDPITHETRQISIKQYIRIKTKKLNDLVSTFKTLIKNYMEELDNTQISYPILKQAMDIYVEEIFPLMTEIRKNKYAVTMMENQGGLFVMKQIKVLPEKLDFLYEQSEIISNKK